MAELLREWKIPLLIHQPSYNLLTAGSIRPACWMRWRPTVPGASPLPRWRKGLLTGKYLNGIPEDSRMQREGKKVRGLNEKC